MNYIERIEVISKGTGSRYILDTSGCQLCDGYVYFYTPEGTRRIKQDSILTINYIGRRLSIGAQVTGAVVGAGAGFTVGNIAKMILRSGMTVPTKAGSIFVNVLSALTGFAVQTTVTPVFQQSAAKFIDSGIAKVSELSNNSAVGGELESVNS